MSAFTAEEISYLRENKLGRLATADAEGQPHAIPVTYFFNEDEDTIDVGGLDFGAGKKWRDVEQNPRSRSSSTTSSGHRVGPGPSRSRRSTRSTRLVHRLRPRHAGLAGPFLK